MSNSKKRVLKDYEKLSPDLLEQVKLVYHDGFGQHLFRFHNKKGDMVSALPFETMDKLYLIRMSIDYADQLILEDEDYDENGSLLEEVREKYEDKHSDVDYLSENDNYES